MSVKSGLFARPGSKDSLGRKSVHPLENVEITYQLPWPILNIVTIDSFAIYRSVFTFLLQLRRARYLLERTQKRAADKQALRIRQKLLWFTGVVVSYLTDLVLRPLSERLRKEMDKAADVDEMVTVHKRFVQDVKEQCLLGSKLQPIHRGIIAVLNLAVKFCRLQEGFHEGDKGGRDSRMRRREGSCSSDDEDMDGGSSRGSQASPSSRGASTVWGDAEEAEKVVGDIGGELDEQVAFVKDGLRGVSRAGVMPHLEMLAEMLEGYGAGWGE